MRRHRRHGAQKISWGAGVIVEAFLRWTDKARSGDRAKAAKALAQAYLEATLPKEKQASAYMAMTYLLDDPSPKVRQALAEALASAHDAPRAILMALAEDQPEIACPVILNSPVLRESDLVDLIGRGSSVTRALIGARPELASGPARRLRKSEASAKSPSCWKIIARKSRLLRCAAYRIASGKIRAFAICFWTGMTFQPTFATLSFCMSARRSHRLPWSAM